jgi:hypothetical protein
MRQVRRQWLVFGSVQMVGIGLEQQVNLVACQQDGHDSHWILVTFSDTVEEVHRQRKHPLVNVITKILQKSIADVIARG